MSRAVLFLCTGNACRSQMAEGFARRLLPPEVAAFGAGTAPAGVHPLATAVMAEVGIDISSQRSKSLADVPLGQVDHVVTLYGDLPPSLSKGGKPWGKPPAEHCPVIPAARREHWPLQDPARAQGSQAEILDSFRSVRDEVLSRVLVLAASMSLEPAIGIIGGSGFYDLPGLTEEVRVADVIAVLKSNVEKARRILARALEVVAPSAPCSCHRVLDSALLTPPEGLDTKARLRVHVLLARRLQPAKHAAMEVAS